MREFPSLGEILNHAYKSFFKDLSCLKFSNYRLKNIIKGYKSTFFDESLLYHDYFSQIQLTNFSLPQMLFFEEGGKGERENISLFYR